MIYLLSHWTKQTQTAKQTTYKTKTKRQIHRQHDSGSTCRRGRLKITYQDTKQNHRSHANNQVRVPISPNCFPYLYYWKKDRSENKNRKQMRTTNRQKYKKSTETPLVPHQRRAKREVNLTQATPQRINIQY